MRVDSFWLDLEGRVGPLQLARSIDAQEEERMAPIKQPPPITGKPGGNLLPPPKPQTTPHRP